jgi:hypothetical protein
MPIKDNTRYLLACIIMLIVAFIQCYQTVHDLHWASEPDFDRDIAYIRATLNGHYGQDPSMLGQYMWYNPIIFLSETLIVKLSGLPINVVVARCGAFLNLINPIVFFIVLVKLFDYKTALESLLCFIFLIAGNLPCWGAATYSPWMVSDTATQWLFYLSILCCYKAFDSQKMVWFIVLGAVLGITFLGHSAPVFIMVFILLIMQGQKVVIALKSKQYKLVGTYFLQGAATVIPFIIFAFPMLYYVYGKYHLHFVNRIILECAPGIFARKETLTLLKLNVTVALVISIIGFIWFYKNFRNPVLRKLIWCWLGVTLVMYVYESAVPTVDKMIHHNLPDTIPAFHYFFYFKALQSIFFGFGFIYLFKLLLQWVSKLSKKEFSANFANNFFVLAVLLYMLVYLPVYNNRWDFSDLRQEALNKEKETDKLGVYNFIVKHVPLDHVLLCPHGLSLFPVMPTAIKMVSIETYFSNPYVSYDQREADRVKMLNFLTTATPDTAKNMFSAYKVGDVLLSDADYKYYNQPSFAKSSVIYKNNSYTLLSFDIKK